MGSVGVQYSWAPVGWIFRRWEWKIIKLACRWPGRQLHRGYRFKNWPTWSEDQSAGELNCSVLLRGRFVTGWDSAFETSEHYWFFKLIVLESTILSHSRNDRKIFLILQNFQMILIHIGFTLIPQNFREFQSKFPNITFLFASVFFVFLIIVTPSLKRFPKRLTYVTF